MPHATTSNIGPSLASLNALRGNAVAYELALFQGSAEEDAREEEGLICILAGIEDLFDYFPPDVARKYLQPHLERLRAAIKVGRKAYPELRNLYNTSREMILGGELKTIRFKSVGLQIVELHEAQKERLTGIYAAVAHFVLAAELHKHHLPSGLRGELSQVLQASVTHKQLPADRGKWRIRRCCSEHGLQAAAQGKNEQPAAQATGADVGDDEIDPFDVE